MNPYNKSRAFTLIELMLSMAFVSVMLVAIALTVIQISNIYNRGLTIKDVNQAGRLLVNEIKASINSSSNFNISSTDLDKYIEQDWGGRICLGQYSYVWNLGEDIDKGDLAKLNIYENSEDIPRFVKVFDPNSSYCADSSKKIIKDDSVELLEGGEHNLAIHKFIVSSFSSANDSKSKQNLYNIELIIGTNNQDAIDKESTELKCKSPSQLGADPAFCSLTKFTVTILSGSLAD